MNEPSLEALLEAHDIVAHHVLEANDDARAIARVLRSRAQPGTRVLLALRPTRSPWSRVRALWNKGESDGDEVETLAHSLLGAGLLAPTLLVETKSLIALSAEIPARPDDLDAVFSHSPRNL